MEESALIGLEMEMLFVFVLLERGGEPSLSQAIALRTRGDTVVRMCRISWTGYAEAGVPSKRSRHPAGCCSLGGKLPLHFHSLNR